MNSVPWHVDGVAPSAQETAEEAAARSGQSLGDWLNSAIWGSAGQQGRRPHPSQACDQSFSTIEARLDSLSQQVVRLATKPAVEPGGMVAPHHFVEALDRLDHRLDHLIQEGRQASREMERRVVSVDRALEVLGQERLRTAFAGGRETIDRAVAEITARQRVLDGAEPGDGQEVDPEAMPAPRPRPEVELSPRSETDLSGLETQLRHITQQLEQLRPCRVDEVVVTLRQDLTEIARTLSEAMPRRALEALEDEVRRLSARIEAHPQTGVAGASTAGLERGLEEVRDALRAMTPAESLVGLDEAVNGLSRKIDSLASGGSDPATLQQLETAVGGLRGIVSHVASGEALAAVAADVRNLADKIDHSAPAPANDLLKALERRIDAIAEAVDAGRRDNGHGVPPALDAMMRSLSEKLDGLQLARSDQLALGNLEDRITRLVEKLDSSEARLGHLGAIERGMAELLVHLEELRAVKDARATGFVDRRAAPPAAGAGSSMAAPPVESLTRDVAEIRQAQSAIGRRTEDSLEAVQGAIGDVVNRLAMIESDLRTDTKAPAGETTASPLAAEMAASEPCGSSAAAAEPARAGGAPDRRKSAAARQPINPSLPADYPLEPGSGAPLMSGTPADRVAASEVPLRAAWSATPAAEEAEPENYLQAARRAARAASQSEGLDPEASSRPKTLNARIKQLFVGAGVVLVVAASFRFAGIYLDPERVILADTPSSSQELAAFSPAIATPHGLSATLSPTARSIAVDDDLLSDVAPNSPKTPRAGSTLADLAPPRGHAVESTNAAPAVSGSRADITGSVPAPQAAKPGAPNRAAPASSSLLSSPAPVVSAPSSSAAASVVGPSAAAPVVPAVPPSSPATAPQPAQGIAKGLVAAATAGDSAAAHEVATRYAEGRGVAQNLEEAAAWYDRAAKRGLAPAQFRLGTMFEKGLGVGKDLHEARRLYLAAADKGNPKAMHNLAVLYAEGIDGKPDYRAAAQWFRKAAGYGVADSQYNLAVLAARGIGVDQSMTEAFKWFSLAAIGGDQEAAKKRDEVAGRLDKSTLMAARLWVQSFSPTVAPEDATTVKAPPGGWEQVGAPTTSTSRSRPAARSSVVAAKLR